MRDKIDDGYSSRTIILLLNLEVPNFFRIPLSDMKLLRIECEKIMKCYVTIAAAEAKSRAAEFKR
jgi:hypothetical protein